MSATEQTPAVKAALDLVASYVMPTGLEVINPANGAHICTVRDWAASEAEAAIGDANAAFADWSARPAKERSAILKKWNALILQHAEELATLATLECGKPIQESRGEVAYAASFIEWFAEEAKRAYGDVIPSPKGDARIVTLKQAIGVTAAITPWNFPLAMITRKAGAALAAGCPMLVKPAEATPLSALALEKFAVEAGVPAAVFKVVSTTNPQAIGGVLCDSPIVRKLSFTGSTAVGKILMRQCAGTVKRVSMELGGNAPFIVFDDADLDKAVEGAIASKYRNAGQTCICANRFLVQDGIHDRFAEALQARVAAMTVGDGLDPATQIGPLINVKAAESITSKVEAAVRDGATVAVGAAPADAGDGFYLPTVLTNVSADMELVRTEMFGPVAALIRFSTQDDAIRLANDTPYGLAAYVYSQSLSTSWRVMEGLEYGMVGVNDGLISSEVAPFGGVKESGVGREGSKYGLDEYMEIKYAMIGGL